MSKVPLNSLTVYAFVFLMYCLGTGECVQAQNYKQFYVEIAEKQKWLFNNHTLSHEYSFTTDDLYFVNFNFLSNIYLRVGMESSKWVGEIGYGREYFASSIGVILPDTDRSFRDVLETQQTNNIDLVIGRVLLQKSFLKRKLDLIGKLGYTFAFGEENPLKFEGLATQVDDNGQLLYSYFTYDRSREQSNLALYFHFAQLEMDLNYRVLSRFGLVLGAGASKGFRDIGRGKIDFWLPNSPEKYESETATKGSSLFFRLGIKVFL